MYIEKVYLNNEENLKHLAKIVEGVAFQYGAECVCIPNVDGENLITFNVTRKSDGRTLCVFKCNDYGRESYWINGNQVDGFHIVLTANDWWRNAMIELIPNYKDKIQYIYDRYMHFRDKADTKLDSAVHEAQQKHKDTIGGLMEEYKRLEGELSKANDSTQELEK